MNCGPVWRVYAGTGMNCGDYATSVYIVWFYNLRTIIIIRRILRNNNKKIILRNINISYNITDCITSVYRIQEQE